MTSISTCYIRYKVSVKTVHKNAPSYNAGQYLTGTMYEIFSSTVTLFPPYFSGIMLKLFFCPKPILP